MLNIKSLLPMLILYTCIAVNLGANPFLGTADGPIPVRPPSSRIPQNLINAQLQFKDRMADLFSLWSDDDESPDKIRVLFPLLGLGFLYGILHALGPGHRKTVVFSLFLGRKSHPLEPLAAGFLSSLLHGFSAVGLILVYRTLSARLFLQKVDSASVYLEGMTYLLLALLGLILFFHDMINWRKGKIRGVKDKGLYTTIIAASFFPCPIAVMILIFSITIDLFFVGILTVSALSLGMGVVISTAGFLSRIGRLVIFSGFRENEQRMRVAGKILEMGSYLFLVLFSLWMALPFLENFL